MKMDPSICVGAIEENAREWLSQETKVGFHWRSIKVTECLLITLF